MYHAFIEVCNKVFSGTPRATIKSLMRALGINLVRCPTNIQEKVRKARPQLASFKVISLITNRDVLVLQAYHQSRAPNESTKFIEVCSCIWERGFRPTRRAKIDKSGFYCRRPRQIMKDNFEKKKKKRKKLFLKCIVRDAVCGMFVFLTGNGIRFHLDWL